MEKKHVSKLSKLGDEFVSSSMLPHIEFDSNEQAVIEGCRGIVEYNVNIVRINCETLIVKFTGYDLSIEALSAGRICVNGKIVSLEFCN